MRITQQLAAQISALHNQCPAQTEWSGILVYEIIEGSADDITVGPLTIKAHAVFPMDFGTSGYTEYESNPSVFKLFDEYPQIDPVKKDPKWFMGHIHSHHNMSSFFSGTDTDELFTNMKNLPIYLSLIVNYACSPVAKIAAVADAEETSINIVRWVIGGSKKKHKNKKKEVKKSEAGYVIECDVVYEGASWFVKQLNEIAEKRKRAVVTTPTYPGNRGHQFQKETTPAWEGMGFKQQKAIPPYGTYNTVMDNMGELITLGENPHLGAYASFDLVSKHLTKEQYDDYAQALKMYFTDYWFSANFINIKVTEEQILDNILEFCKYVYNCPIKEPVAKFANELKTELPTLRTI